jgi:hypothetical protein
MKTAGTPSGDRPRPVAAITGVSGGLGLALAARFRRGGFTVAGIARSEPPAGAVDRFIAADLTIPAERRRAVAELAALGRLDVLINNAGIGSYATWEELDEADLRRVFEIDFFAPVALTRELIGTLAASRGAVINISSMAAHIPVACMGAYNAAKAALRMFSETLRMETRGRGIQVLDVCPGRINTGFSKRALGARQVPETPGRSSSDAAVFADRVFDACRRKRWSLTYPRWYGPVAFFIRLFPGVCLRVNRKIWKLEDEN